MNLLPCTIIDGNLILGHSLVSIPSVFLDELADRTEVILGIRPEKCYPAVMNPMVTATTTFVENLGSQQVAHMDIPAGTHLYLTTNDKTETGSIHGFNFDWHDICLFDSTNGIALG